MSEENKAVKLPEPGTLILSSSPHIHAPGGVGKIMLQVLLCLFPAMIASVWFFGFNAFKILVFCTGFCVLFEYLWNRAVKGPRTIRDWSAAVTGVILALNISSDTPWWVCAVGSFIAIVIAKQVFGGIGQNPFNPAAVARVALLVGFTGPMTRFTANVHTLDVFSGATPLTAAAGAVGNLDKMNALQCGPVYWNAFLGNIGGSLGETSALAILIGGVGLLAFKLIRWQIPASILGTIAVFTMIVNWLSPATTPGPLFHLLTGGVMIGAFFMATDMVTSPITWKGCVVFGVGIGVITSVIRIWGAYPEGMSFAIVIMNALVPLIDRLCYNRPFGWTPIHGGAK